MMELDEIKNAWTAMDERLKKNEGLNERMIKEMLMQKSKKSLNRLIVVEIYSTIFMLFVFPFLLFVFNNKIVHTTLIDINFYIAFAMIIIGIGPQMYKTILLININLSKSICDSIKSIQKYNLITKRKILYAAIIGPIFFASLILGILSYKNVEVWNLSFIIVVVIVSVFSSYWQYKKVYKANIQSILESLEELKDLEE